MSLEGVKEGLGLFLHIILSLNLIINLILFYRLIKNKHNNNRYLFWFIVDILIEIYISINIMFING